MTLLHEWAAAWGVSPAALTDLTARLTVTEPQPDAPKDASEASEARVQSEIRLAAPRLGLTLWRNNSGALPDNTGRLLRFGLGNESKQLNDVMKSSDLIGIGPSGRFIAVEVKKPGWTKPTNARENAQKTFIDLVNMRGGKAMFCTTPEHLKNLLVP